MQGHPQPAQQPERYVLRLAMKRLHRPATLLALIMASQLAACTASPQRSALPAQWLGSPNFDERRPNLVIIHHTSDDTAEQALRTLSAAERKVSAHYLIARDGALTQLVDENRRAWHAGKSWWGGHTDINSTSLGIELDNNGSEPFAEAQIVTLLALLADLRQRYGIPPANFIAHGDVAPTRKDDPSVQFPWQRLALQGFGLWCDTAAPAAPAGYDLSLALAAIGYDPATPDAARRAFRRHFLANDQTDANAVEEEKAVAHCLLQKRMTATR